MKKQFNRVLCAVLAVTGIMLCGCEKLGTEIVDLMIIQGIAIDVEDNGYYVCVQTLNNAQSSFSNGENKAEQPSLQYHSRGDTIAEALERAVTVSGKEPLYAHNKIIRRGEKAAKKGLGDILDFFVRDYNTRPNVPLAVARGTTAQSVIEAKIEKDLITSEVIEDIINRSNIFGRAVQSRVLDTVNLSKEPTSSVCLPVVTVKDDGEYKELAADGTAVFDKDNKLKGYLDEEQTFGLMLVNEKTDKGVFNVTTSDGEKATLVIESISTHVKAYVNERDVPCFDVVIKASCDINEYLSKYESQLNAQALQRIKEAAAKKITELARDATQASQKKLGCDCFRFGRRLWFSERKVFESAKDRWDEHYANAVINTEARVTIRRVGEESFFRKEPTDKA